MLEALIAGALAGYAIAIPVGAIAVLIIHAGIRDGLRAGLAAGAGAASADGIYATVAVVAGSAAAGVIEPLQTPLRLIAGVVLLGLAARGFLGLRSARDPAAATAARSARAHHHTFLTFLVLTLLNPVTVAYFAALVLGLGRRADVSEQVVFIVAVFVASLSWQSLLAVFGSVVGRRSDHRLRLATGIMGNLIVLGFGVLILAQAAGL